MPAVIDWGIEKGMPGEAMGTELGGGAYEGAGWYDGACITT